MKKTFNILKTVLFWFLMTVAVLLMIFTVVSVNTFDKSDRSLFGYKMLIVQTDSMAATDFAAGDLIISKEVDVSTLVEGDIITFISESSSNYGETVTHKIRRVTTDNKGGIAFVTYGTTTNTDDEALATFVIGKYVGRIPGLGKFFLFMKTVPGYIVCILTPFLLLMLSQVWSIICQLRKYKAQQKQELMEERENIERERAENKRMMEELLRLKAELSENNNSVNAEQEAIPEDKPEQS